MLFWFSFGLKFIVVFLSGRNLSLPLIVTFIWLLTLRRSSIVVESGMFYYSNPETFFYCCSIIWISFSSCFFVRVSSNPLWDYPSINYVSLPLLVWLSSSCGNSYLFRTRKDGTFWNFTCCLGVLSWLNYYLFISGLIKIGSKLYLIIRIILD